MLYTMLMGFLIVIEIISAVLLLIVILLQKSRSHGAAAGLAFGAGMGESLFGAQATNILQKITIWLATIFLVCTTLLAVVGSHRRVGGATSVTDMPGAVPEQTQQSAPMQSPLEGAPMQVPSQPMSDAPVSFQEGQAVGPVAPVAPEAAVPAVPAPAPDAATQPAQP